MKFRAIYLILQASYAGYRVSYTYKELAAAYALAGKLEDAKIALAEALGLSPNLTINGWREQIPNRLCLKASARRGYRRGDCAFGGMRHDARSLSGTDEKLTSSRAFLRSVAKTAPNE
jgi:hypothetical protein